MPFYLGRLGALRQLRDPMKGLDATNERLGATHRSLNGTTTVDTLGHKRTYKLQWDYLTHDELSYVEALYLGLIDGPLRLIDPQRKNRLAAQASSGGSRFRNIAGFTPTQGTVTFTPSTPPPEVFAAGAITWAIPATTGGRLIVGDNLTGRVPLITGEQVTLSIYATGEGLTARAVVVPFDAAGVAGAPVFGPAIGLTAVYQRLAVTLTPNTGQAGCAVGLDVPSGGPAGMVTTTGWQLEAATTASPWGPGSGCPVVVVESLADTYPEYGYHASTLTLLEA
ncbi:hypothetical protein JOF56_005707 [Kibdelosporangium banguiense]|uniref:Uncharacterized protein n=1 Tax=Kibdelosporangium banguiense TaxID=1365924 RepID=A0ABS4TLM1_9PSEU|nr:hypothetical protein [Kibdelosporangium banguiense]MBP2325322.1 hypothetical protein [Kibdelosporangium banguiense]